MVLLVYGFDRKVNEIILVFDLGGGMFDVFVLEVGDGVFEVLLIFGDMYFGGDDFDKVSWSGDGSVCKCMLVVVYWWGV